MKTKLLRNLLDCGYADVDYAVGLFEKFEIDPDDLFNELLEYDAIRNVEDLIDNIFLKALKNAGAIRDDWYKRVSIFLNYLDSYLSIDDEKVYNKTELENALKKK